mmetsp:Transcript_2415/g.3613  ORF Transcript_2415/g.3613 Transcript_2415/m.3613 type:complete len:314 (+) Transcript_2415:102-1043(+)
MNFNCISPPNVLNSHSCREPARSMSQKQELLQIIDVVVGSLRKARIISNKRRNKKIKELDALRQQITALDENKVHMEMVLLQTALMPGCLPNFGLGRTPKVHDFVVKNQLSSSLEMLDGLTSSIRSDVATIGDNSTLSNLHFTIDFGDSSSDEGEDHTVLPFKIASQEDYTSIMPTDTDSTDSADDMSIMTSSLSSPSGPLGVSVTTWRRQSIKDETLIRRNQRSSSRPNLSRESSKSDTSKSDISTNEHHGLLEEVSVTLGEGIVVHATRKKSVRFVGVKPTVEDNLNRARELLHRARQMSDSGIIANRGNQ